MWDNTRRRGNPRSNDERAERHAREHPDTPLPPRGTGLGDNDETRRRGNPRSEDERIVRHEQEHPGTPLPSRGTGLTDRSIGRISDGREIPVAIPIAVIVGAFIYLLAWDDINSWANRKVRKMKS